MKMNKILVKLYVPSIEHEYDIWIPLSKRVYNVTSLLIKAVNEFSRGYYNPTKMPLLYDRQTGKPYDINLTVKDANIRNGAEIVLL